MSFELSTQGGGGMKIKKWKSVSKTIVRGEMTGQRYGWMLVNFWSRENSVMGEQSLRATAVWMCLKAPQVTNVFEQTFLLSLPILIFPSVGSMHCWDKEGQSTRCSLRPQEAVCSHHLPLWLFLGLTQAWQTTVSEKHGRWEEVWGSIFSLTWRPGLGCHLTSSHSFMTSCLWNVESVPLRALVS